MWNVYLMLSIFSGWTLGVSSWPSGTFLEHTTGSWLPSVSLVLLAMACCLGLLAGIRAALNGVREQKRGSTGWTNIVNFLITPSTGLSASALLLSVFNCLAVISVVMDQAHTHRPYEVMDHVRIRQRFDQQTFEMEATNPRTQQLIGFTASICDSFHPNDEWQPGITFILFQFVRDQQHHCFDISQPDMGFTIERDKANAPIIRSSYAGQTAPHSAD